MKKETRIIVFYVLYFSWLFTVTFLTNDADVLNLFTFIVAFFYLIFLREQGDVLWFFLSSLIPVAVLVLSFSDWSFRADFSPISIYPLWLSLAWGTTTVALRKLYIVLTS